MRRLLPPLLAVMSILPLANEAARGEEPAEKVFSGPQAGEKLASFKARGLTGDLAGKEFDLVETAKGKPLFIVFVHERTRPSLGMTRLLMTYALKRAKDGLTSGVVFLSDDATELETWVKRATAALPANVPLGIALDGGEGPGAYGLNRKVALTVLVASEGKVTANFALVQPSVQADVPLVLKELVAALGGGDVPTLADLGVRPEPKTDVPNLRPYLAPVIKRDATPEEVEKAAAAVEEFVAKSEAARKELGRIGRTIVDAGKLKDYGTPPAQEHLKKWAEKYGGK